MSMKYQQINLQQIGYFLAVAKYLNFTEAAKNLYVSQPSLSKQIALLEGEIGVQLFIRTKRTVNLTAAGEYLFEKLSGIHEAIYSAVDEARRIDSDCTGSLTIGCLEMLDTNQFLLSPMEYFNSIYPNINITLERHSFKALRERLLSGKLDMIFTLSFELEAMNVESRTIYETSGCIAVSRSNPLAAREVVRLEDLKDEKFLMISRDETPNGFDSIIALCRSHGFTPNIVKQLPNAESLLLCVESGQGVALLDSYVRVFDSNKVRRIPLENNQVQVVIAWKSENRNPSIKLFVDTLLEKQ